MTQIVEAELLGQSLDIPANIADGPLNDPRPTLVGALAVGHHHL
jgi:hypothetical protein